MHQNSIQPNVHVKQLQMYVRRWMDGCLLIDQQNKATASWLVFFTYYKKITCHRYELSQLGQRQTSRFSSILYLVRKYGYQVWFIYSCLNPNSCECFGMCNTIFLSNLNIVPCDKNILLSTPSPAFPMSGWVSRLITISNSPFSSHQRASDAVPTDVSHRPPAPP